MGLCGPVHDKDSWTFDLDPGGVDPVLGIHRLQEAFFARDPDYPRGITVPAMVDIPTGQVVTNDFPWITHDFFFEWREHHRPDAPDLWPDDVREEMEAVMKRVFTEVNNGVYRCGFAGSQEAYDEAYDRLWTALDWLEERLADRRYLMGDAITEADVRLFTTLARFDAVYHGHFKCNRNKLDRDAAPVGLRPRPVPDPRLRRDDRLRPDQAALLHRAERREPLGHRARRAPSATAGSPRTAASRSAEPSRSALGRSAARRQARWRPGSVGAALGRGRPPRRPARRRAHRLGVLVRPWPAAALGWAGGGPPRTTKSFCRIRTRHSTPAANAMTAAISDDVVQGVDDGRGADPVDQVEGLLAGGLAAGRLGRLLGALGRGVHLATGQGAGEAVEGGGRHLAGEVGAHGVGHLLAEDRAEGGDAGGDPDLAEGGVHAAGHAGALDRHDADRGRGERRVDHPDADARHGEARDQVGPRGVGLDAEDAAAARRRGSGSPGAISHLTGTFSVSRPAMAAAKNEAPERNRNRTPVSTAE